MNRFVVILLLIPSLLWFAAVDIGLDSEKIWKDGKKAENQGNFEKALRIWESAKTKENLSPDPRIAFDYIELVSVKDMTSYFEKASAMYFWGISQGCNNKHLKSYSNELSRVQPLLSDDEYDKWEELLNNDLGTFCKELGNFWRRMDPTVNTKYNERLIEHWKRIAYSKEHFKKNGSSFFGTDDRANIYIRYGAPNTISSGTLQFRPGLVRAWIQDIVDFQNQTGNAPETSGNIANNLEATTQSSTGSSFIQNQGLEEFKAVDRIAKKVLLLHKYPSYEIWVYREFNESKYGNLIYIFGQDGDTGSFGLRKSLDEMIPSRAFSNSSGNFGKLKPGILLQLLFYEQTTQVDNYFENAFNEIESKLFTRNGFHRNTSSQIEMQNKTVLRNRVYKAPSQSSDFDKNIPFIDMAVSQYRILDENNEPALATYIVSSPQTAFYLDQSRERDFRARNYQYKNNVVLFDENNNVIQKKSVNTKIDILTGRGSINDLKKSVSYFSVTNNSKDKSQFFTAELLNQSQDSTRISENLSKENLRGFAKVEKNQPEPLNTNTDVLEMSDIILGYANQQEALDYGGPAHFHIAYDGKIDQNNNLAIHFEVYHLDLGSEGNSTFKVEYQVESKSGNFLKKLFSGSDKISLTLNFETPKSFYKSDLEIETSSFDPGVYELSLTATDPISGQEVNRTVEFEVVESETKN